MKYDSLFLSNKHGHLSVIDCTTWKFFLTLMLLLVHSDWNSCIFIGQMKKWDSLLRIGRKSGRISNTTRCKWLGRILRWEIVVRSCIRPYVYVSFIVKKLIYVLSYICFKLWRKYRRYSYTRLFTNLLFVWAEKFCRSMISQLSCEGGKEKRREPFGLCWRWG